MNMDCMQNFRIPSGRIEIKKDEAMPSVTIYDLKCLNPISLENPFILMSGLVEISLNNLLTALYNLEDEQSLKLIPGTYQEKGYRF